MQSPDEARLFPDLRIEKGRQTRFLPHAESKELYNPTDSGESPASVSCKPGVDPRAEISQYELKLSILRYRLLRDFR
jgi:hypothetical protein